MIKNNTYVWFPAKHTDGSWSMTSMDKSTAVPVFDSVVKDENVVPEDKCIALKVFFYPNGSFGFQGLEVDCGLTISSLVVCERWVVETDSGSTISPSKLPSSSVFESTLTTSSSSTKGSDLTSIQTTTSFDTSSTETSLQESSYATPETISTSTNTSPISNQQFSAIKSTEPSTIWTLASEDSVVLNVSLSTLNMSTTTSGSSTEKSTDNPNEPFTSQPSPTEFNISWIDNIMNPGTEFNEFEPHH